MGNFVYSLVKSELGRNALKLREKNPDVELTVKKTKLPLPWKTYE